MFYEHLAAFYNIEVHLLDDNEEDLVCKEYIDELPIEESSEKIYEMVLVM